MGQSSFESNKFPGRVDAAYAGLWVTCSNKAGCTCVRVEVGSIGFQNQNHFACYFEWIVYIHSFQKLLQIHCSDFQPRWRYR